MRRSLPHPTAFTSTLTSSRCFPAPRSPRRPAARRAVRPHRRRASRRTNSVAIGAKRRLFSSHHAAGFMGTRLNTGADQSDRSQISDRIQLVMLKELTRTESGSGTNRRSFGISLMPAMGGSCGHRGRGPDRARPPPLTQTGSGICTATTCRPNRSRAVQRNACACATRSWRDFAFPIVAPFGNCALPRSFRHTR